MILLFPNANKLGNSGDFPQGMMKKSGCATQRSVRSTLLDASFEGLPSGNQPHGWLENPPK